MAKKKAASRPKPKKNRKRSKALDRENYHLPVRTEEEQTGELSEDLQDAWKTLRSFMSRLGPQEIRTSHRAVMFARKTCYAFVRPKKKFLELNVFLRESLKSEFIKKSTAVSKTKFVNIIPITHSDQVESPITDWIRDAFDFAK